MLLLFAFLLQAAEFGHFLFVAALETRFLELQVLELLFVFEESAELDQVGAGGPVQGAVLLIFGAALGIDRHFETGDALQTPLGVGEGLDELLLAESGGLVLPGVGCEVLPIDIGIVVVEQHGAAG